MKQNYFALLMLFLLLTLSWSMDPDDSNATGYTPVLLQKEDLPKSISFREAQPFEKPGKIYTYRQTLFIVDLFTGIHMINNADPENPVKEAFIYIPGVMDISVKDDILYADNAVDLISLDLNALPDIKILDRMEEVFPEPTPPDLDRIPYAYSSHNRPENTVIVGWKK